MNASETLLREILREMQKQTQILERIDRNLSQTDDLDPSETERRKSFRQDLDQLRETPVSYTHLTLPTILRV